MASRKAGVRVGDLRRDKAAPRLVQPNSIGQRSGSVKRNYCPIRQQTPSVTNQAPHSRVRPQSPTTSGAPPEPAGGTHCPIVTDHSRVVLGQKTGRQLYEQLTKAILNLPHCRSGAFIVPNPAQVVGWTVIGNRQATPAPLCAVDARFLKKERPRVRRHAPTPLVSHATC
jgi:hypothetical protein